MFLIHACYSKMITLFHFFFVISVHVQFFDKQKKVYLVEWYMSILKLCRLYVNIKRLRTSALHCMR